MTIEHRRMAVPSPRQEPQLFLMLMLLVPWCLLQLGYHAAADAFSLHQPHQQPAFMCRRAGANNIPHATAAPVEAAPPSPANAASSLPGVFDQESWASLFRSLDREAYDYDIEEIEGQIPTDLEGVYVGYWPTSDACRSILF